VQTINQALESLQAVTNPARVQLPEALKEVSPDVIQATRNLNILSAEYVAITGWHGIGGVALMQNDLLTQSIDELLNRINTANTADPNAGWPEAQNSVPELRMRLIHAIIEARARTISPAVTLPQPEFSQLVNGAPAGWEITEHQLLTLTAEEILQFIRSRQATNPTRYLGLGLLTAPQIELARADARDRLSARSQGLEQMETFLKTQIEIATKATSTEREQNLGAAENLLRREANGTLINGTNIVYDNRLDYADGALVGGDMNYTEAERTLNLPRGYYELLDVLFDYKTQTQLPRDEYFRTLHRVLPPNQLAQDLSDALMLGTGTDIDLTLAQMRLRMDPADGRLDPYQLGRAFRRISYEVGQWALAI